MKINHGCIRCCGLVVEHDVKVWIGNPNHNPAPTTPRGIRRLIRRAEKAGLPKVVSELKRTLERMQRKVA